MCEITVGIDKNEKKEAIWFYIKNNLKYLHIILSYQNWKKKSVLGII